MERLRNLLRLSMKGMESYTICEQSQCATASSDLEANKLQLVTTSFGDTFRGRA